MARSRSKARYGVSSASLGKPNRRQRPPLRPMAEAKARTRSSDQRWPAKPKAAKVEPALPRAPAAAAPKLALSCSTATAPFGTPSPQSTQTDGNPRGTARTMPRMAPPTNPAGCSSSNIRATRSASSGASRCVSQANRHPRRRPSRIRERKKPS